VLRERLDVDEVVASCRGKRPAEIVAGWLAGAPRALIAIDAPLGWPTPLADALANHRAGAEIDTSSNLMFRRTTDRLIRERTSKQPLDVGADRIARAAHAALAFLGELRRLLGCPVPLAWSPGSEGVTAIEVYPAATLRILDIDGGAYKKSGLAGEGSRRQLVATLGERVALSATARSEMERGDDPIDAVVAAMAGEDFLCGRAIAPEPHERPTAEREGWIWVRRRA
jgi:predicted nuclease with RNAse H fold